MTSSRRTRYADKTLEQLTAIQRRIEADPANHTPPGSLYRFTKAARAHLEDIAWAIYHKTQAAREHGGEPR